MRSLRRHQRHEYDHYQVVDRQRRIGGLRDEYDGEREIDRETVEVEPNNRSGSRGRRWSPSHHPFELAHDLRQHGVRRSGAEHDQQFLAQITHELKMLKPVSRITTPSTTKTNRKQLA